MDLDIEMMDVDYVQDEPVPQLPQPDDIITGEEQEPGEIEEAPNSQEHGEVGEHDLVPYKVHVKGLDTFNPDDVKTYLAQHYGTTQLNRVEWVDDSSANYVFKSEASAQEALIALAAVEIVDATQLPPLQEIAAKGYAHKPDCMLRVRFAVVGDRKPPRAAERSRYYLLHPEYDPEERRRNGGYNNRGKYRDRDDRYRRDKRNDRRRGSRDDDCPVDEPFDVNLYDDTTSAQSKPTETRPRLRRPSSSNSSDPRRLPSRGQQNRGRELFPEKLPGGGYGLRDRSASPVRDRDGDAELGLDENARAAAALRSREKGRSIKERLSRENSAKELFPLKSNKPKELFPTKVKSGSGGKAQMDQVSDTTVLASARLADRITPRVSTTRLADRITPRVSTSNPSGFNIRGSANKRGDDQGIAIKGMGTTVKELFPEKFGNTGKEPFSANLGGKGRRRQRAEDMFH